MKAIWNDTVLAESDDIVRVEGNAYFPEDSIWHEHFKLTEARSLCHWKGTARYYDITVDGQTNRGAAWTYPDPSPGASKIKDRVAFWKGVKLSD